MSFYDEMRDLAREMMGEFAVPAILWRVNGKLDPKTDRRAKWEVQTACLAVLTPRKSVAANGLLVVQTTAKVDQKPEVGDRLEIGCNKYTVEAVEEIAPDGNAIIWTAVLS